MKKNRTVWLAMLLIAALLAGCSGESQSPSPSASEPAPTPEASASVPPEQSPSPSQQPEEEQSSPAPDIEVAYAEQIARYHTALSEQWTAEQYFEAGMSELPAYYYEGDPLENVGYGLVDLDNDGNPELVIGAILNAENDPVVFEIWTMADGQPVMLAQSGSRNRYILQYADEDQIWYVANEANNSAASFATYYFVLWEGELKVSQGVLFDAAANQENPWFMTYDTDWDPANDTPVEEDLALAIMESYQSRCVAFDYNPYSRYQ